METEKCRVLIEIIKRGSLTAAAQSLGYTPSGLSRMMKSLEEDAGIALFVRNREGVRPTAECEKLLPLYKEFVTLDDKYNQVVSELTGLQTGTVVVGTAYSIYYKWLSEVIAAFKEEYPGIEVKIHDGKSTELYAQIAEREMDFCIVSRREGDVSWHYLFDDPLVAIVSANSEIGNLDRFPIKLFETEPYIETYPGQDTDNARMFSKNGIKPNIRFKTEDTYASHRMVGAGLGVSLSNLIESKERSRDKSVRLMEVEPRQMVEIGIATPKPENLSPVAKRFKEFAMEKLVMFK